MGPVCPEKHIDSANLSLSLKRKSRARTASATPEVAPTKHPCLVAVNADRFAFSNEDSCGKMSVPFVC